MYKSNIVKKEKVIVVVYKRFQIVIQNINTISNNINKN